jgi:hypothetical protein
MPHPLVVNVRIHAYDIYCGRGSSPNGSPLPRIPLGNPWSHTDKNAAQFQVSTREESIKKHAIYFARRFETDLDFSTFIRSLKGKRLGCWCAPLPCHCDIIARYANNEEMQIVKETS